MENRAVLSTVTMESFSKGAVASCWRTRGDEFHLSRPTNGRCKCRQAPPIAAGGGKWEMLASPTAVRCPAFVGVNPQYVAASVPQSAVGLGASATVLTARPTGMKRGFSEA